MLTLRFPAGLSAKTFLTDYWQHSPLLMRQAIPDFHCRLHAETLAGLACEEEVESRLVLETHGSSPWEVHYGPFREGDFSSLPPTNWTLMVQDVDKHLPEIARLVDCFDFLPSWRFDDVMVSYAVDQGSVGPHIDDYDVFLFQAAGKRHWKIQIQQISEADYIPGIDLRVLPEFETEQEWLLEPGDILYLPPHVAHWGIAEGESLTCSIGYRAPALRDMVTSWCEDLVEQRMPTERYRDGRLIIQESASEIRPQVIKQLDELLSGFLRCNIEDRRHWFGRFITEQKQNLFVEPAAVKLEPLDFLNQLRELGVIHRNHCSRMAFSRGKHSDSLFVNGAEYTLAVQHGGFLPVLTHYRDLHFGYLEAWLEQQDCLKLACDLYNDGHFEFLADGNPDEVNAHK